MATLASFKNAWAKGRHCIVPAEAIYEPDWRSGKHVPTRFTMADGEPMGIAGLWQPWRAPTGEWVNSFAMLTINADEHPLMNQMHRPDPKRPPLEKIQGRRKNAERRDITERRVDSLRPYHDQLKNWRNQWFNVQR